MTDLILATQSLHKSFGGLRATFDVSLGIARGSIHAIIGPNGAGKTTLLSQLFGQLKPDSGTVMLDGRDISALPTTARVKLGMARSFQITSLCPQLTVRQNALLASQLRRGGWTGFWRRADSSADAVARADFVLAQVGLAAKGDLAAEQLSYGEQRQLEIAVALSLDPRIILLDEPLAGLGPDEAQVMIDLLRALKGQYTMLLVEHDMEAVFSLADEITVLDFGRVIASGPPAVIRQHPEVRRAYLGSEDDAYAESH